MQDRWFAVNKRTVVLVFLLGFPGLIIPSPAYATPTSTPTSRGPSDGARANGATSISVPALGVTRHEGRHRRLAKAKGKHQPKMRVAEARTKSAAKPLAGGQRRQEKLACAEAFDTAKNTARDLHFRAAKGWFARCARPSCGRSLRKQCGALQVQVTAALPSVVPVVADATGSASGDIEVKIDGEPLTSHLDGTAIVVDPGDHEFTFVKNGEVFATQRLAIEKGQRNQIVSVSLPSQEHKNVELSPTPIVEERAPAPERRRLLVTETKPQVADTDGENKPGEDEPAPRLVHGGSARRASVEADPRSGAPWSAYALAGVGLLGVGGYGVFTLKGRADNDGLAALCKPDCDPTSVKHVRNIYLAADISLGIGVAALIGSTYLFLRSDDAEESQRSRTSHISTLGVAPTSSGALATVGGTF